jgi:hypothetical protein
MGLKTRHIQQNMSQIKDELQREVMDRILPKLKWEKHGAVRDNPNIKSDAIIDKTSTDKFPADSITVRVTSAKNKRFTVYLHGEKKERTFTNYNGKKTSYFYTTEKLKISVDCNPQRGSIGYRAGSLTPRNTRVSYSYTGDLPDYLDQYDVAAACDYITDNLFGEENGN